MNTIKNLWRANKGFAVLISLMFVFRSAVADWNYVPSSSMNPTLWAGDRSHARSLCSMASQKIRAIDTASLT